MSNNNNNECRDKVLEVAAKHDAHSRHFGVFAYVDALKNWVDTEAGKECFLPSGPLYSMDYNRGILCLAYYKPSTRVNDCVVCLSSVDDQGVSVFGKPSSEEAVLKVLDNWRRFGLPDREQLQKEFLDIGIYPDWW